MSMQVVILSKKFIKPATPTPETLAHYKISLLDEISPAMNSSIVLFFSINSDQNPKFIAKLESSLGKILRSFNPLAGRYLQEIHVVECKDQGVEFIQAKANTKLQDIIVDSDTNVSLVDDLIPFAMGATDQVTDPILGIQATTFECGGLALGVSISHRIADASTFGTFLNEWAATSREENHVVNAAKGFNSPTFFPGRGLPPLGPGFPRTKISDDVVGTYPTKKLSFSDSDISRLKSKINNAQHWSKVQLVSTIIWKALIEIDQRDSILMRPISLRRKEISFIPKETSGNLCGLLSTEWKNTTSSVETPTTKALGDLLRENVRNFVNAYLEVSHDIEKVQTMVLNSFFSINKTSIKTASLVSISSWCNYPFYEADYGFGKPVRVSIGSIKLPMKYSVTLLDGTQGNGVDAYVTMAHEDVPLLEKAVCMADFVA